MLVRKVIKKFEKYFHIKVIDKLSKENEVISSKTLSKSIKILKKTNDIAIAIGCEKKGLIWAGSVFKESKTKLIYYSLELYEDGHYSFTNDKNFPLVREQEVFFHQKCAATIVQDPGRCDYLYHINNIDKIPRLYLPVSVSMSTSNLYPEYLQKRINVIGKKIILYFGKIDDERRVS
ncbi:MAG: hypothetical protein NTV31_00370, partial [Bacteroidia bacterium]|nr:hypothetical protein [Bacteroidia bacterium]